MQTYFQNNNSSELILLLDGWGMDKKPYSPLESTRDILFVSDYSNFDFNLPDGFDFSKYNKKFLICFSAGVFMAGHLNKKNILPKIDCSIAVNGTLTPGRENHGVPETILDEMRNLSYETALDFRKKLIYKEEHVDLFNQNQPKRSLESSMEELDALENLFSTHTDNHFDFDKVILGKNDEIILHENALKAWLNNNNTRILEGGHFMFYNFSNFDEIIDL